MKWQDYVLKVDEELLTIWRPLSEPIVFIIGAGFDPRALLGLRRFLAVRPNSRPRVIIVDLPRAGGTSQTDDLAEQNATALAELVAAYQLIIERVPYPSAVDRHSVGQQVFWHIVDAKLIAKVSSVVVDISGLPGVIYFPIVAGLLEQMRRGDLSGDIQVLTCENPQIDAAILDEGAVDPGPLSGFIHDLAAADQRQTLVWAPVLGEGQGEQLRLIYDYLQPRELTPVLPFPAMNPRRADDLLLEHRELLGYMQVEPDSLIYASENNPFDLYRALIGLSTRYQAILAPLGSSKVVASSHASKLLSVGVLLAAWEEGLPVVTGGPAGYSIKGGVDLQSLENGNRLVGIWLDGAPYR